jgi:phage terminase Nu1 subunit (DNA packaging protein)
MANTGIQAKKLAMLLDVSLARIGQLRKEGVIFQLPDGTYPLEAVPLYIKFIRDNKQKNDYSELLDEEKYREKKRQNDEAEKLLISIHNVLEFPERLAAQIVPILESLPLIMKRNWPEITGDQTLLVKKSVAECLNAIDSIKIRID